MYNDRIKLSLIRNRGVNAKICFSKVPNTNRKKKLKSGAGTSEKDPLPSTKDYLNINRYFPSYLKDDTFKR